MDSSKYESVFYAIQVSWLIGGCLIYYSALYLVLKGKISLYDKGDEEWNNTLDSLRLITENASYLSGYQLTILFIQFVVIFVATKLFVVLLWPLCLTNYLFFNKGK